MLSNRLIMESCDLCGEFTERLDQCILCDAIMCEGCAFATDEGNICSSCYENEANIFSPVE